MPQKISVGDPAEEQKLFTSEAWQNASPEQRTNFVSKIRATHKIEKEREQKQEKKTAVLFPKPQKRTAYQRRKETRRAKAERKKQRLALAKQLGFVVKQPKPNATPKPQKVAGVDVTTTEFLSTYEWRKTRMVALKKYGARCQCCGATPATGAVIHVDHIKPRKLFPALALDVDNLQVLCHECNHGKGNWDQTDWRPETTV
jgi:5-methylcytosine-specific restriction endonuclease McrA